MAVPQLGTSTLVTASLLLLAATRPVAAADAAPFPRGPGLYFNPSAVILALAGFFGWVRSCTWVDRDARRLGLEIVQWNTLVFAGGVAGLLALWVLPIFLLAYPTFLFLYLAPLGFYVQARNARVPPERQVWTPGWFKKLFRRHLGVELPIEDEVGPASRAGPPIRLRLRPRDAADEKRIRKAKDAPGYSRVMDLLTDAVQRRATEVKLQPGRRGVAVEYRIDGVAHPGASLPKSGGASALQLLKTLAGFSAFDSSQPQEGAFSAEAERRRINFRVSASAETAANQLDVRVQDRSQQLLDLALLGMSETVRARVSQSLSQARGLLVICGRPDSGRTTTAHACLNEIDRLQKSVFAVEERHEIHLPKITYRKAGDSFAEEIKSVVRQKPDVLQVGDVPDQETAELVCQAARKALVIVELSAADAVAGLFQLLDLGVPGQDLAEVILGVLAGRLLRVLCPVCKLRYVPDSESLRKVNLSSERVAHLCRARRPQERRKVADDRAVCRYCDDLGYHGRTGVFEHLLVTERIRGLLRDNPLAGPIRQEAVKAGLSFLADEALRLVIEGTTSVEEMLRVMR